MSEIPEDIHSAGRAAISAVVIGLKNGRSGPGYIWETSHGFGVTYHNDPPVNGKLMVFCEDGKKYLIRPENMKHNGHID